MRKRRKPIRKKDLNKIEFVAKKLIEELYEKVENKILWKEANAAEPLPKPKSYYDLLME